MTINSREKKVMRKRGLIPTPASGALSGWKGDATDETYLVEYKYTDKKQFILKEEIWNKVSKESLKAHKVPRLEIEFGSGTYLVIMDAKDFDEMKERD